MTTNILPLNDDSRDAGADVLAREDWLEAKLTRHFMRNGRPALHAATLVIPVFVAVLYNDVNNTALLCWAFAAVVMTLVRYRVVNLYHRDYAGASGAQLKTFLSR